MITIFFKDDAGIHSHVISAADGLPKNVLWVDIQSPTMEEEQSIELQLGIQIPTKEEVWRNEVLNRFYSENGAHYMTAAIITKMDSPHPLTSAITFILMKNCLVTMRYISPTSFTNFSQRIVRYPHKFKDGADVFDGLLEEIITRVAHNSELVVQELDMLSHEIFAETGFSTKDKNPSQAMKLILGRLGKCADLNSKINESLHSLHRLLNFFRDAEPHCKEVKQGIRTLDNDVEALTRQTTFLSDKIVFQLDATLGMINVEQNVIIKIFSVVAVFFLPPTLVSSIYGMNFHNMPELNWAFGYPMAICIMVLCALVPFIYFRKKGWL